MSAVTNLLYGQMTMLGRGGVALDLLEIEDALELNPKTSENTLESILKYMKGLSIDDSTHQISRVISYITTCPSSNDTQEIERQNFVVKVLEHMLHKRDDNLHILSRLNLSKYSIEKSCVKKQSSLLSRISHLFKMYLSVNNFEDMRICLQGLVDLENRCSRCFVGDLFVLPTEMLAKIFSCLSTKDLCSLKFVCKRIAPFVEDGPLARYVVQRDFPWMSCCDIRTSPIILLEKKHKILSRIKTEKLDISKDRSRRKVFFRVRYDLVNSTLPPFTSRYARNKWVTVQNEGKPRVFEFWDTVYPFSLFLLHDTDTALYVKEHKSQSIKYFCAQTLNSYDFSFESVEIVYGLLFLLNSRSNLIRVFDLDTQDEYRSIKLPSSICLLPNSQLQIVSDKLYFHAITIQIKNDPESYRMACEHVVIKPSENLYFLNLFDNLAKELPPLLS